MRSSEDVSQEPRADDAEANHEDWQQYDGIADDYEPVVPLFIGQCAPFWPRKPRDRLRWMIRMVTPNHERQYIKQSKHGRSYP